MKNHVKLTKNSYWISKYENVLFFKKCHINLLIFLLPNIKNINFGSKILLKKFNIATFVFLKIKTQK